MRISHRGKGAGVSAATKSSMHEVYTRPLWLRLALLDVDRVHHDFRAVSTSNLRS